MLFTKKYLESLQSKKTIRERIESKIIINENGCWNYSGGKDRCGYGRIKIGKHSIGAHKAYFIMVIGDYDQDSLELLHSCDNPSCVNPEHISTGTHKENMHDCINKGRHTCQTKSRHERSGGVLVIASTRQMALWNGDKTYSGKECKKHESNSIRITANGACVLCNSMYNKGKRKDVQKWSMKCALIIK